MESAVFCFATAWWPLNKLLSSGAVAAVQSSMIESEASLVCEAHSSPRCGDHPHPSQGAGGLHASLSKVAAVCTANTVVIL